MLNIGRILKRATIALWLIGSILCGVLFYFLPVRPEKFEPVLPSQSIKWPDAVQITPKQIQAISSTSPIATSTASISRYRLAGTFLQFSDAPGEEQRLAILDDLELDRQHLMMEGDRDGGLEVVKVEENRVEILHQGIRKILELSFQETTAPSVVLAKKEEDKETIRFESMPAIETSVFGKQVATNQWVFQREALLGYYNEMMDNPERLAKLYMSFMPEYNDEDKIKGYELNPQGEDQFLTHMGMLEGDVVRKVNSLEMTSQRRAEYFIGTFARDELNAVVLDIEREGKAQKLIYMIR